MIQKRNSGDYIFFIQCGDWEAVKASQSPLHAAVEARLEAQSKYGKENLKLSDVMVVMNLQQEIENHDNAISAFSQETLDRAERIYQEQVTA